MEFDPERVAVEQLEGWLRETGTFVRTLERTGKPHSAEVNRKPFGEGTK